MGDDLPHFSGFGEDYDEQEQQMSIIFGRAFKFPHLNFQNEGGTLEVISKELDAVLDAAQSKLEQERDSRTAVVQGPEDCWALSLLIYAGEMTKRSAPGNVKDMFERNRLNRGGFPGF